jgi:protein-S-isoprenylcysteine O-methyltransferase Ste14
LLTVLGFAGLGTLAVYRLLLAPPGVPVIAAAASMVLYAAWMVWESRISVAEIAKTDGDFDRGTMEQCAAVKLSLLLAALALPPIDTPAWARLVAILLLGAGIWVRSSAIRAMGSGYSHRIRKPALPLTADGPYRFIRHPAYAGTLLIHSAVVMQFPNVASLTLLAAWFVAVWWRTRVEETFLQAIPEYAMYSKSVAGKWWPGQALVPLLLSGLLVAAIGVLFARQLTVLPESTAFALGLVVALYLLWIVVEARIARKELAQERTSIDRGTMELYAAGRAVTALAGLAFPPRWEELGAWYAIGISLFVGGLVLRLKAIQTLGQFYSHRVRLQDSHEIVSTGPYRFLRHPAYTGMIVAHAGYVICFYNPVSVAMLTLVLIPAVILRIRVEEKALFSLSGYGSYARNRRRLIPLVW